MPINLGDLNKQREEEYRNSFIDLDGLHVSKNAYSNSQSRLRKLQEQKMDAWEKQKKKDYERENASFLERAINTVADVGLDIVEGGLGYLEGGVDWASYRLADLSNLIGQEQWAKGLRENADFDSTGAWFGKNKNEQDNIFGNWTEGIENKSYSNDFVDQIFQGVGQVGMAAGTSVLTGGSSLATAGIVYASSYGNARSEAKRNGASDEEANKVGVIHGIAEAISEQFFSGIPGMKVEGWGDKFSGKLSDKISGYFGTRAGKIALKTFDSLGEGAEEILSNVLVAAGNDITHYFDNNFSYGMEGQTGNLIEDTLAQFTSSDSLTQFISASITSALVNGAKNVIDTRTQNKIINAYAKDNNMSFQDAKYILTGQLENAKQEIQRDKTKYNSQAELNEMAKNRVLNFMKNYTGENIETRIEEEIDKEEEEKGIKFSEQERETLRRNIRSYYEDMINSRERYTQFTQETDNEKDAALVKSLQEAKLNNTKQAHEVYDFVKSITDKNPNAKIEFTNNELLEKQGAKITDENGKNAMINGYYKDGVIHINMNTKNPYRQVVYHEIGHAIKESDEQLYNEMKNLIFELKGKERLSDYRDLYKVKDGDISSELTDNIEDEYVNDMLGEILESERFINTFKDNRNLLQKILDKLKELISSITSTQEKKHFRQIEKRIQELYKQGYEDASFKGSEKTDYSLLDIFKKKNTQENERLYVASDELKEEILNKTRNNLKDEKNIEYVSPDSVINGQNNGGYRTDEQVEGTVLGIKQRGFTSPIRVFKNENGETEIYDGNHRYEAAKKMGLKEIPIRYETNNDIKYSLSGDLPKVKDGYTRLYRGLNNEYDPKYDRSSLDSPNGYDTLTDNYDLAKEYGKNVYYIDIPTNQITDSIIDENPNSETYGDRNLVYKDDKPASINGVKGNEYLLYTDHDNFNSEDYHKIDTNINNKYLLSYDSLGRELSKEQQEYFKDSKVRDENGNLEVLHHQTNNDFTVFKSGFGITGFKNAHFFTNQDLKQIRKNKLDVYVNITNPLYLDNTSIQQYIVDNAIKDGYDGIINQNIGGVKGKNEYVAFNSNQIKNVDNINPTTNEDIRYQLGTQENLPTGLENTKLIETTEDYLNTLPKTSLPINTQEEDNELPFYVGEDENINQSNYGVLTKEDYRNKKKELLNNYIDRTATKIDEQVKQVARRNLELKSKDVADLRNLVDKYKEMSREDIYSSSAKEDLRNFVIDHSHQEYEEQLINDEIRNLQKDIRSREFIISNDYKGDFPDGITRFKKNNPGINIKFGNKGNLDTQLQELANMYPGQLSEEVSYGDIPYVLADILKKDYKQVKTQEFNLTEKEIDDITNKLFYGLTNNAMSDADLNNFVSTIQDKIRNKYARQMAIKEYRELAKDMLGDITKIKDKKRGLLYQVNTMKRNLRDIMNKEQATKMYDTYFKPISIHNAQIETEINNYNERIQQYNLTNEESTYTQMLGELKYNPKSDLTQQVVDNYLMEHRNKIDTKKVNSAIEEFRNIYDELIVRINESLEANGYKPIDYRKGYFPHFIEDKATSPIGKLAEKLGWKVQKGQLPTDIAGITDEFQPGKAWTSFSQRRTGDATDYNALKGMDNYLRGAMDVIYHTQDIQRLRALEAEIRYQYSEKGIQEKLDAIYNDPELSNEEKYSKAAEITDNAKNNPLGNFATELRNYTNNLANKKSISDRGMEQTLGRDMYSIMNNITGRVSANMVGANISSAMTNFIPITQAWSQVKTKNMLRGIYDTIKASIRDDGFSKNSIYLTNRTQQADRLYKTGLDKVGDKLSKPFEAVDEFTSNVIVRAKYYENIQNGMSEIEAIDNADEFAKDVMAGRSKGDQPTMFNKKNPLSKLFTAFQLEVNNQYGYMFKDMPNDIGKDAKDKLAKAFIKLFLGAWLYNAISEQITGRKAAFSPIDMAIDESKIITNDNLDLASKIKNIANDVAQEAPFLGGILGGGRLPIQGAIPYENPLDMILSTGENIGGLFDDEKRAKAIKSLTKEWSKPVYYIALPFAGGQLKKTVEGLSMYGSEIPGSYTDSGRLRFEADTTPIGVLQSAVFGRNASKEAREYRESGYETLTEKKVKEALEANLPISEYKKIDKEIRKVKKIAKDNKESQSEAEYNYIYNLPISMEQKNKLLNARKEYSDNITDDNGYVKYTDGNNTYWYDENNNKVYNSKYIEMPNIKISKLKKYSNLKDLTDYGKYGSLDEYNYANDNPVKYAITQQITDYDSYVGYKNKIAAIKDNYNNGTKAGQQKAQQEVFKYINSLPLNKYQKLMLQKLGAGYSIKNFESQVFNYINGLQLSKVEKQKIHKELFE